MQTDHIKTFPKILLGAALTIAELFVGCVVAAYPVVLVSFGGYSNRAIPIFLHPLSILLYILIIAAIVSLDRLAYRGSRSNFATVSCIQIILSFLLLCVYTVCILYFSIYGMISLFTVFILFVLPSLTVLIAGYVNWIFQIAE